MIPRDFYELSQLSIVTSGIDRHRCVSQRTFFCAKQEKIHMSFIFTCLEIPVYLASIPLLYCKDVVEKPENHPVGRYVVLPPIHLGEMIEDIFSPVKLKGYLDVKYGEKLDEDE